MHRIIWLTVTCQIYFIMSTKNKSKTLVSESSQVDSKKELPYVVERLSREEAQALSRKLDHFIAKLEEYLELKKAEKGKEVNHG